MKAYIGITDYEWYQLLSSRPHLVELNFWQPGGKHGFRALHPGELFLFKLHAPRNFLVGGGFFAHATRLPVSLAWGAFGESNGATTLVEMRTRIERYRKAVAKPHEDYTIGCILLEQPFLLPEHLWIPASLGVRGGEAGGQERGQRAATLRVRLPQGGSTRDPDRRPGVALLSPGRAGRLRRAPCLQARSRPA